MAYNDKMTVDRFGSVGPSEWGDDEGELTTPSQRQAGYFDIVGTGADTLGLDALKKIGSDALRQMPQLGNNESLVCFYDQTGINMPALTKVIICHSEAEMQELIQRYKQGWAMRLTWYKAPETFLGLSSGNFKSLDS